MRQRFKFIHVNILGAERNVDNKHLIFMMQVYIY